MEEDDSSLPIVEAKSQEIQGKEQTTLFVPDDDVIIETVPASSPATDGTSGQLQTNPVSSTVFLPAVTTTTTTKTTTTVEPTAAAATPETSGGFVPVKTEEEPAEQVTDAQTEVTPEVLVVNPSGPAVDSAPWKPIDEDSAQGRFIEAEPADDQQSVSKDDLKTTTTTTDRITISTSTSIRPLEEVSQQPEEESTEFALMQDLGNMALLVPEDRIRTSTPTGSSSTTTEQLTSLSPGNYIEAFSPIFSNKISRNSNYYVTGRAATAMYPATVAILPRCLALLGNGPAQLGRRPNGSRAQSERALL